jgi:hypothetical protein
MSKVYISPIASSVPFDNSSNGFTSTDVQSAIEEAGIGTGIGAEEFSHSSIDNDLIIKNKRQMLVYQEIEIEAGKNLDILGELVLIE